MILSRILHGIETENPFEDVEISLVTQKAELCIPGSVFVCIKGMNNDGHDKIEEAEKNGAVCFVTEKEIEGKTYIKVKNSRLCYGVMCSNYFDNPSKQLKLIGVTGTNGKSATADIIYNSLSLMGKKAGLSGTVRNITGEGETLGEYTTPDSFEYNKMLREAVDNGIEYFVSEISSQALHQERVYGCEFSVGVFTNITHDHLDYHKTFTEYLYSKKKLFELCDKAVINLDDEHFDEIVRDIPCPYITFSKDKNEADLVAKSVYVNEKSVDYAAVMNDNIGKIHYNTTGMFSVYNTLGALGALVSSGLDFNECAGVMKALPTVKGRAEFLETGRDFDIVIDYAHTPNALYNICTTLNTHKKNRLITVFGCGGNRDREKRRTMGEIASEKSDIIIVTDDNPRNEDPKEIIEDIFKGIKFKRKNIYVKHDRKEAIILAVKLAEKGDIILLAGKGHETYQRVGNKKIPFDERETVKEILSTD